MLWFPAGSHQAEWMAGAPAKAQWRNTMLRQRMETALSLLFGMLAAVTLFWPDWIEALTGLDPDQGSGAVEWGIVAVLGILALAAALLARRDYRLASRRMQAADNAAP
jgi:hypothetical protein